MPARNQGTKYQGSKWIRQERRLAIYMRDGLACVYCGHALEDGVILTLDHVDAWSNGGSSKNENLVTACRRCNGAKGRRTVEEFAVVVAGYLNHDVKAENIIAHVHETRRRPVNVKAAKAMIAQRGSYSAVLKGK